MPFAAFVLLFKFIAEVMRVIVRKMREVTPKPLCAECFFAHVQYGANARRVISCTYGGEVRPVKLDVLCCTDYRTRDVPLRRAIGFVREIARGE
jgi:hypothetical protein